MRLPPGRDVRAALDSMLEAFCEHHLQQKFQEMTESEHIELLEEFEHQLSKRAYSLKVKRLKKRGVRV